MKKPKKNKKQEKYHEAYKAGFSAGYESGKYKAIESIQRLITNKQKEI